MPHLAAPTSPLDGNPLRSRADFQVAVQQLVAPLLRYFSPGCARVGLGSLGSLSAPEATELEGFARPLWGIAPLVAGGGAFDALERFQQGLTHGTDPRHPEYWGQPGDHDQRLVEMGTIGAALALAPEAFFWALEPSARSAVDRWLARLDEVAVGDHNWLFFRVLSGLGRGRVGGPCDGAGMQAALDRIDALYQGDGWYSDGPSGPLDHYAGFAMHFYGLLYAALAGDADPVRAARWRERASRFAQDFQSWFAADGAALPLGRSLTYRFAQGAFWGALAFAGVEALPWGAIRGHWARHLRYWSQQQIFARDGVLSLGYAYENPGLCEQYSAPGSPYWAFKFFLPLALPESHPFWRAEEVAAAELDPVLPQEKPALVIGRDTAGGHVLALSAQRSASWVRHGAEKYGKLAYSTYFGFSVPSGRRGLEQGAFDSMLALSDDGVHYRPRTHSLRTELLGDVLYSRWAPWSDVQVETWLLFSLPWHVRVHYLRSPRRLWSGEGGWAIDRGAQRGGVAEPETAAAYVSPAGLSAVRDLLGARRGKIVLPDANTSLIWPRTAIPTLVGEHPAGDAWLVCAVVGRASRVATLEDLWRDLPRATAVADGVSVQTAQRAYRFAARLPGGAP